LKLFTESTAERQKTVKWTYVSTETKTPAAGWEMACKEKKTATTKGLTLSR
jgi:hypothetical protein